MQIKQNSQKADETEKVNDHFHKLFHKSIENSNNFSFRKSNVPNNSKSLLLNHVWKRFT
jgi:hypothetical protein